MIELTEKGGGSLWINPLHVDFIRESKLTAGTVVTVNRNAHHVSDTIQSVIHKIQEYHFTFGPAFDVVRERLVGNMNEYLKNKG